MKTFLFKTLSPILVVFACASAMAASQPMGVGDGSPADRQLLLARRAGFGGAVTGGLSGPTHHVTTNAETGPGSLREALGLPGSQWVVFDGDYTIKVTSGVDVSGNKTIDGRGRRVTLTGHTKPGFLITDAQNVIIENLILHDFGDTERTKFNDKPDAINIYASHGVWVDHCSLSKAGDKLVAVDFGSTGVTVSWCRFEDQMQVFQIGNMTNQKADVAQQVTSHHNFFDSTGYRHPVVSYGYVHAYNNYIRHWQTYGMRSERNGQLYSEANVFEPGEKNRIATRFNTGGNGWNDNHTLHDERPGYIRSVNDLKLDHAAIKTNQPEMVQDPHKFYSYTAEPANEALMKSVSTYAGWQPSASAPEGKGK